MATRELIVLMHGRRLGTVIQNDNRLTLRYEQAWQTAPTAIPLSLSMPLDRVEHEDALISAFMWGLLPDNELTLNEWGKRHQVSAGNCFALLAAVGEDCPGAIQFMTSEKIATAQSQDDIEWLDDNRFETLINQLATNSGRSRLNATGGQFSLAGAQAKTALYRENGRWGIPRGRRPTTHILKPLADQRDGMPENEHFCLKLAARAGLRVAESEMLTVGGMPVICSTRYDRPRNASRQIVRLHQEDMCQALGMHPRHKYENEEGPTALRIMQLLQQASSAAVEDRDRFVRALAFNFVIGGTDAHAKNYSLLLAAKKQVRLAPLYDLSSYLPYMGKDKGVKLAMKIGGHYAMDEVTPRHWQLFAETAAFAPERALVHVRDLLARLPGEALGLLHDCRREGLAAPILDQIVDGLWDRAKILARSYGAELLAEAS